MDTPLPLDCGRVLKNVNIRYETAGTLNESRTNAVLVTHALSGDAHFCGRHTPEDKKPGWWDEMIGPGKAVDTNKYFVICSNVIGGCAGSTAGGLKVSRVMLLFKSIRRDVKRMLHPRSVAVVKLEGKAVDEATIHGSTVYFAVYFAFFFIFLLLLSLEPFDFESTFTAVSACFNNIGPGLGAFGPAASFAAYSPFGKLLLSAAMLLGRLEIFPLLIAFSPSTWTKK